MLIFLLLALLAFTYYIKLNWSRKKIPHMVLNEVKLLFLLIKYFFEGNPVSAQIEINKVFWSLRNSFNKEGIYLVQSTFKSLVLLFKPETVEPILKSPEHLQKGRTCLVCAPFFGESYLFSSGDVYRSKKKYIGPVFKYLGDRVHVFNEHADILVKKLEEGMESHEFLKIEPVVSPCSFDIIYELGMGIKLNSQVTGAWPIQQAISEASVLMFARIFQPWQWIDWIYFRTAAGKSLLKNVEIANTFTDEILRRKLPDMNIKIEPKTSSTDPLPEIDLEMLNELWEQNKVGTQKRASFLDTFLPIFKERKWSHMDLINDTNSVLFAGYDTITSTVSWTLYNLGLHPEIQGKVHDELDRVLGNKADNNITPEDIKNLKYIECVIKETLRLFPSFPIISRKLESDMQINGYKLSKGMNVVLCIHMIHKDPDVFPNPEVFDPDRFQPANCSKRHPYAFFPFSAGIRICLGQKIALAESVVLVAKILRRFEVRAMLPMEKIEVFFGPALKSKDGLFVSFKSRRIFQE